MKEEEKEETYLLVKHICCNPSYMQERPQHMSSTAAVMTCFKKLKEMFTIREYVGSFQVFGGFLK
jgi:hypothetical protein